MREVGDVAVGVTPVATPALCGAGELTEAGAVLFQGSISGRTSRVAAPARAARITVPARAGARPLRRRSADGAAGLDALDSVPPWPGVRSDASGEPLRDVLGTSRANVDGTSPVAAPQWPQNAPMAFCPH